MKFKNNTNRCIAFSKVVNTQYPPFSSFIHVFPRETVEYDDRVQALKAGLTEVVSAPAPAVNPAKK